MLQKLYEIMRFRNTCPAFDGEFWVNDSLENGRLQIRWTNGWSKADLNADFSTKEWEICYTDENGSVRKIES